MTRIVSTECTCFICGAKNQYRVLASTNAFGSPDLDLRPSEMQRSTMSVWVQECPECGYVSGKISDASRVSKQWLQSKKFITCEGMEFVSSLAKRFYKYYMINIEDEAMEDAFYAILHAAWACDDAGDLENAKKCRKRAILVIEEIGKRKEGCRDSILLIKADLLRRAEDFDTLISEYKNIKFNDDIMDKIMIFQLKKAEENDSLCYRIEDAIGIA